MSTGGGQRGGSGGGGSGGGKRRGGGGGKGAGGGRPPGGQRRGPGGGHGGAIKRGPDGKPIGHTPGGGQQQPIEIAVRSTRNAIKRHADGLRDDQVKLACRSLLIALHGNLEHAENPGEVLTLVEQVLRVLHATRRDEAQLPVAVRAVVGFAMETPARQREVQELVRQLLRHVYALSSDFIPRQARDDGRFRATALLDLFAVIAREYLDDAAFEKLRG